MGKEGDNLGDDRRPGHWTRRLLQIQNQHPPLLQKGPWGCGLAAWDSLQHADCQLLQGRSPHLMGTGP
jgi:hypothetical protein